MWRSAIVEVTQTHGVRLQGIPVIGNSVYSRRSPRLTYPRSSQNEPLEANGVSDRAIPFHSVPGEECCDDCQQADSDISYCNDCNIYLCTTCWPLQTAHRTQRTTRRGTGARHEPTNITLARKINNVLIPPSDLKELSQLHAADAQTAWFGKSDLGRASAMLTTAGCHRPVDAGNPTFMDYGRFAQLLSTTAEIW